MEMNTTRRFIANRQDPPHGGSDLYWAQWVQYTNIEQCPSHNSNWSGYPCTHNQITSHFVPICEVDRNVESKSLLTALLKIYLPLSR